MRREQEMALARWLQRHHGVITWDEAMDNGITPDLLADLVARGRLRRVYRGVYAETALRTNPALTAGATALAAAGPAAALSHRSAGWVWGLLKQPPAKVDLLLPLGSRSRLPGASVHRTPLPFVVLSRQELRVTEPVRTMIDIAAVAPGLLATVVDRGLADGLVHISHLEAATRRAAGHPQRGVAVLRAHLHESGHLGAPQPSVLESLMMRRVFRRYDLPAPEMEVTAGPFGQYRIDFAYPQLMLAIEVDGYVWHSSRVQMDADNARRNHLRTLGWHLLVYTWRQVTSDPDKVAAEILANYRRLAAA
jgi:hypothetical protein